MPNEPNEHRLYTQAIRAPHLFPVKFIVGRFSYVFKLKPIQLIWLKWRDSHKSERALVENIVQICSWSYNLFSLKACKKSASQPMWKPQFDKTSVSNNFIVPQYQNNAYYGSKHIVTKVFGYQLLLSKELGNFHTTLDEKGNSVH